MPLIDHVLVGLKNSLYYALAYNVGFQKTLGSKYSWGTQENRFFKSLHAIWNKKNSFEMKRKRVKYKISHRKNQEKSEFGSPRSESLCTPIMLGPFNIINIP